MNCSAPRQVRVVSRRLRLATFTSFALSLMIGCGYVHLDLSGNDADERDQDDDGQTGGVDAGGSGGKEDGGSGSSTGGSGLGGEGAVNGGGGEPGAGGDAGLGGDDGAGGEPITGGSNGSGGDATGGAVGSGGDGSGGAPLTECSTGEFSEPTLIADLQVEGEHWSPGVTQNGLVLYFAVSNETSERIYRSTRADRTSQFGPADVVEFQTEQDYRATPFINGDETRLYFALQSGADQATRDLYFAERQPGDVAFGLPQELFGLNSSDRDLLPWLTADELTIYFAQSPAVGIWETDVVVAHRSEKDQAFDAPKVLEEISGTAEDSSPSLSPDGLTIYFSSDRLGVFDIWSATRDLATAAFGSPVREEGLSSLANDVNVRVSPDGREIYISSDRDGSQRLYVATRDCSDSSD